MNDEIVIAFSIIGLIFLAFSLVYLRDEYKYSLKMKRLIKEHEEELLNLERRKQRAEDIKRKELEDYTRTREEAYKKEYEKKKLLERIKERNFFHKREKEFNKKSKQANIRWK